MALSRASVGQNWRERGMDFEREFWAISMYDKKVPETLLGANICHLLINAAVNQRLSVPASI
ncbi:putative uncharacterized protein [Methylocaldum marinum]|uniref:Uncharacterized protein n=1 Tax=Methylocaldum marinum TaxID=1432792 RepID=A0A250KS59_9GAMM|nr:putative uncharacterized protein [Methylocaldum marinum]